MTDVKFAESIIDIIEPSYFDNEYMRLIVARIKDYHDKYGTIPIYDTLEQSVKIEVKRDITLQYVIDTINEIKNCDQTDSLFIQDRGLKFCKQQELKKASGKIQKILESGDFDRYDECEEILKDALSVGDNRDDSVDVFNAIEEVLSEDFRHPIPTGIVGIDNIMEGGLSRSELGLVLAAYGVGKSTILTKFANTAYNSGYNVVQIVFEDPVKVIQRKHLACWTGIELNSLHKNSEKIKKAIDKIRNNSKGKLIIKKFPSDGITISNIKSYLRKLRSSGIKVDLLIIDYIDCISSNKQYKDEWSGEGDVMRQLETLISELDIAAWTATQGNRSSIGEEIVEGNKMGGSIKKGQVAGFILSVGKTLEQKENNRATMAVIKSRIGKDGVIFEDIMFDNGRVHIDTEVSSSVTLFDYEKGEEKRRQQRVLKAVDNRNKLLNKENYKDPNND